MPQIWCLNPQVPRLSLASSTRRMSCFAFEHYRQPHELPHHGQIKRAHNHPPRYRDDQSEGWDRRAVRQTDPGEVVQSIANPRSLPLIRCNVATQDGLTIDHLCVLCCPESLDEPWGGLQRDGGSRLERVVGCRREAREGTRRGWV